jgi:acyl-CoA hydrolase
VADLYGKTIRQRARQLINIAHPDFRRDLEKEARELRYL